MFFIYHEFSTILDKFTCINRNDFDGGNGNFPTTITANATTHAISMSFAEDFASPLGRSRTLSSPFFLQNLFRENQVKNV